MKYFFILIPLLISSFTIDLYKKQVVQNEIIGVRVRTIVPIPSKEGDYIFRNVYDVYHSGIFTLYRISVNVDSSIMHSLSGREEYFDLGVRYRFFVFSNDSLYGINYSLVDHRRSIEISRITVDSIKRLCNTRFEMAPDENGKNLVPDSIYATADGNLVNVYRFKKNKQYPEDFVYDYHYSKKFLGVPETFGVSYDTIKGMKLYKIAVKACGGYYEKEKFMMPPRTYIYEMESVPPSDINTAATFFDRYRKYMKQE